MNILVLSVTRDRLDYTKHCFARLRELAGCEYTHYVFDNGSQDDTVEWLRDEYDPDLLVASPANVGISRALNALLEEAGGFDVIVKFDNDCEPVTDGCLADTAAFVCENPKWVASPRILGLNSPPPVEREVVMGGTRFGVTGLIGGIFLAAHASMYDGWRHDENNPVWGMDDVSICERARKRGGGCGYLLDHQANHYETTVGQHERYGWYFQRRVTEGGPD